MEYDRSFFSLITKNGFELKTGSFGLFLTSQDFIYRKEKQILESILWNNLKNNVVDYGDTCL